MAARRPSEQQGGGNDGVPEGEEDPMEKELHEDAIWKRIQKNTFTR